MSFSGRVCTTSTSKTIGNGIDHTLDNPKGIFLLSLLTFSCRLLVIIVPTSNISTFEATSTFSSITATILIKGVFDVVSEPLVVSTNEQVLDGEDACVVSSPVPSVAASPNNNISWFGIENRSTLLFARIGSSFGGHSPALKKLERFSVQKVTGDGADNIIGLEIQKVLWMTLIDLEKLDSE
ncbi:hypothetical protein JHK86_001323 [Glycine max]|nr:hypothetical protein JHK86_001323 [Glycine max]